MALSQEPFWGPWDAGPSRYSDCYGARRAPVPLSGAPNNAAAQAVDGVERMAGAQPSLSGRGTVVRRL
jgi:hypothetical protein